ncbi:GMC family oxidoreductase [Blastococcus sp. BMG 814]|uniref:long-chain-alcohol oxidase n=1 Tax=Blastococcus carthaginiensis TaxID=3050034 RepID=A0ABT9IAB3_9ACTN|nr:GMC family oxidoreductase [Blastococcus carthaginiensis]MDP5182508.1 GMC family oxidoreductase [Blastococcus carthaginiensis]
MTVLDRAEQLHTDTGVLRRLCDTLVPAVEPSGGEAAEVRALLRRTASDLGLHEILPGVLGGMAPHVRAAVEATLQAWWPGADGSLQEATRRWNVVAETADTAFGAMVLRSTVCAMFYTAPDAQGRNPSWPAISFDGPLLEPPSEADFPKTLAIATVPAESRELHADVVVVGSGAGGGVAAARLAAAGRSVLVLERGAYRNEPDLPQLEALSFPNLYLDGGYVWSENGRLAMLAGATTGGGTTVNSMACLPTPEYVLDEWTARGVEGVAPENFTPHLTEVQDRINARVENTRHNAVNRLLIRAFEKRGLEWQVLPRNARDDDDRYCGSCNAGCLLGCKQSTMKTFLQDASDAGALLLPGCRAERLLVADGAVTGVEATVTAADGTRTSLVVHAPTVVLAAGTLSTPLLLQASGIGGPAVGENLHVHPSYFMSGVFDEPVHGWRGQILTSWCREFERVQEDHGFLVEAAPMGLGFWTGLTPWRDGAAHKQDQLRLSHVSGVWGFVRDHGAGRITADAEGRPLATWDLDDDVDLAVVRRCHQELARLLHAAGAREIFTFLPGDPRWREGEDFEAFVALLGDLRADEVFTLSAHQSGSCAAGTDPLRSVVDGRGRLHDVAGAWIADASAFPSAPGVNPMVSIEAYASRTAGFILES